MIPMSKIKQGDMFQNPMFKPWGIIYMIEDIDLKEKMVKVQCFALKDNIPSPLKEPFWIKNTNRMLCESWRF